MNDVKHSLRAALRGSGNARMAAVLGTNIALTVLAAQVAGPSTGKLEDLFGMIGWVGRAPFYLLPLYLGPTVLWARPSVRAGIVIGLAVGIPLALWAVATLCPVFVPATHLASGAIQGGVLARIARGGRGRPRT